jgi:hypothetical protein
VVLTVSKPRAEGTAEYSVAGSVTSHRVKANFGKLGRISLRFHRTGVKHRHPPFGLFKCKGRQPIREIGRFEGRIRFRGEGGYTSTSVDAARGTILRRFKRRCGLVLGGDRRAARRALDGLHPRGSLILTDLIALSRSAGRTILLEAAHAEATQGKHHFAVAFVAGAVEEHRGRISIRRSTFIEGDEGTILASAAGLQPLTVTVTPPRPFAGSASYLEEAGKPPTWSGSLRVRLPGATVPLTGQGFVAKLCRGANREKVEACIREAAPTPIP